MPTDNIDYYDFINVRIAHSMTLMTKNSNSLVLRVYSKEKKYLLFRSYKDIIENYVIMEEKLAIYFPQRFEYS